MEHPGAVRMGRRVKGGVRLSKPGPDDTRIVATPIGNRAITDAALQ